MTFDKIKSIPKEFSKTLEMNLNKYIGLAKEEGAMDCKVIRNSDIVIDIRSRVKCMFPKCEHYGTNVHCPPYTPDIKTVKEVVSAYSVGLLLCLKIQPERIVGDLAPQQERAKDRRKLNEIIIKIESQAFYDGYYFVTGFSCGSCKLTWCLNSSCQALEKGKGCRFPLKARPSMEAMGFDVYKMASKAGWEIYPIGRNCKPNEVPYGLRVGLVLIK